MAKTEIFTLGLDGTQYLNVATKLQKSIVNLNEKQKILARTTRGKTSKAFVQNASDLKELKTNYNNVLKANSEFNNQQKTTASLTKNVTAELKKEAVTINEANQQTARLNKIKKSLNVNNKEEKKLLKDINSRLDDNTNFVKENSSSIEKQKINIGNYSSALDGVSPRLKGWITQGTTLISGLKAQRLALKGTTGGLKLFKIALISTGIGAIAVALGLFITYLTSTQAGIDKVTRVLEPLKIIFQSLLGVVQDLGEGMSEAFTNPKKAILNLWKSIKTNLVNRIVAIGGIFKSLGTIISSGFTDGYDDFAEATLQLTTGVEDFAGKIKNAANKTGEFLKEAAERGSKIADLSIEISKQESQIALKRARNLDLIKQQEIISKDKTKTIQQQNQALKIAEEATKSNLNLENSIVKLKVEKLKLEQQSNDTSREGNTELNELEAQLETNRTKSRGVELRFLGVKNQIKAKNHALAVSRQKEITEKEKQALNDAIENYSIELEIFKENNKQKFNLDKELSANFVKSKIAYLDIINRKENDNLIFKFKNGLIKENEYNLAKIQLENEFQESKRTLIKSLQDQEEQEKLAKLETDREARQLEFELQLEENSINRQTEYERKIEEEALIFENDQAILQEQLTSKQITEDEFNRRNEILEAKHLKNLTKLKKEEADRQKKIEAIKNKAKLDALSSTFNNVAELIGKETALGKAAAIAATTIDTYQSAVSAYKGMIDAIPGPVGIAAGAVAAALSIATGLSTVKKIVAVKKPSVPKAEKGALFNLKGKRHSQGGEDIHIGGKLAGNMEGGEIFGVMSREASNSFLKFNNAHTDGAPTNNGFFENGGAISTLDTSSATSNVTNGFDAELLASSIGETVNNIKIVVPVLDVEDAINDNNAVIAQANI